MLSTYGVCGADGVYGAYSVCAIMVSIISLLWCLMVPMVQTVSIVPMVSVVSIVSVVPMVRYGVCGTICDDIYDGYWLIHSVHMYQPVYWDCICINQCIRTTCVSISVLELHVCVDSI